MKLHPVTASLTEFLFIGGTILLLWPVTWWQILAVIVTVTVCRFTYEASQNYKRERLK